MPAYAKISMMPQPTEEDSSDEELEYADAASGRAASPHGPFLGMLIPTFAKIAVAVEWTGLSLVTICVHPFDCFRLTIYRDSFLWLLDTIICKCCLSFDFYEDTCVLPLPCELVLTV